MKRFNRPILNHISAFWIEKKIIFLYRKIIKHLYSTKLKDGWIGCILRIGIPLIAIHLYATRTVCTRIRQTYVTYNTPHTHNTAYIPKSSHTRVTPIENFCTGHTFPD